MILPLCSSPHPNLSCSCGHFAAISLAENQLKSLFSLKICLWKKSVQPSISHPRKTTNPLFHFRWTDLASNGNDVLIILWYEVSCAAEKWKHVSSFYIMMSFSDGLGCNKPGNILMIALHLSNDCFFFFFVCSCVSHLVIYFFYLFLKPELYLEFWLEKHVITKMSERKVLQKGDGRG